MPAGTWSFHVLHPVFFSAFGFRIDAFRTRCGSSISPPPLSHLDAAEPMSGFRHPRWEEQLPDASWDSYHHCFKGVPKDHGFTMFYYSMLETRVKDR